MHHKILAIQHHYLVLRQIAFQRVHNSRNTLPVQIMMVILVNFQKEVILVQTDGK